ncbi:MAG TPA: dihydrolipoamide acetyltransferase family protein [Allosphingosinicella sp.]|jgi:2-oxoisovalerate dehydrogenase E2 component (dihydrolipoyl transacylase)|nr:dihydrolipoamide acetyltransferase family protein [Allosphingosinicella sp.]
MARYEFKLPDIGEGIAEAEIVAWHVKVGDMVKEDQQLADMMTDKATVEMESPVAGKVLEVAGEVGDQVPIGSVLVVFETDGEAPAEEKEPATIPAAPDERRPEGERHDEVAFTDGLVEERPELEAAVPSTGEDRRAADRRQQDRRGEADRRGEERAEPGRREGERRQGDRRSQESLGTSEEGGEKKHVLASPAVRQRARDLGIDLSRVKTTGDRIRHADLDAYLLYSGGSVSHARRPRRQDEQVKVVGLRRRIAENMQEAKRRIPHFTLVEEYDVTALEQTRAMMNADRGSNPKLTMLPFLIMAMARTLADYPQINATYDDEAQVITRSGAVHMGMATQTPNGLMVPVIRNADGMGPWEIASEILRLSEAARTGKAARDELSGSTITISSLGPMGGVTSTPVINRPEVAIIAVNKVEEKPVVIGGKIEVRKRMNLSLSCDHRVVDGWDAANFMQNLKKLIEAPLKLLSA